MHISALMVENIRTSSGSHEIALDPGLNVFVGRNNAGKSTLLRSPTVITHAFVNYAGAAIGRTRRTDTVRSGVGMRLAVSKERLYQALPELPGALENAVITGHTLGGTPKSIPLLSHPDMARWKRGGSASLEFDVSAETAGDASLVRLRLLANDGAQIVTAVNSPSEGSGWLELTDRAAPMQLGNHPSPASWKEALRALLSQAMTHWAHRPTDDAATSGQSARRLLSDDDATVQEALTFLKMKNTPAFDALAGAVVRALPEFGRLDFDDAYKPAFGRGDAILTRGLVGSGSWTYLAVLTAARVAAATGAKVLVLDEPHLYLHPGLERRLVRDLTEGWGPNPLQLLVATHSPVFLDAAWRKGAVHLLEWADAARTAVVVHKLDGADVRRRLAKAVSVQSFADLAYADRVVFVEGPSDALAFEALFQNEQSSPGLRFVAIKEADNAKDRSFVNALRVVARGGVVGHAQKPVLALDEDKRGVVDKGWDKWGPDDPNLQFDVQWLGTPGHDAESMFADVTFLESFFPATKKKPLEAADSERIATYVSAVSSPPPGSSSSSKGSQLFAKLYEEILGTDDQTAAKVDRLLPLCEFYASAERSLPRVEAFMRVVIGTDARASNRSP